MISSVLKHLLLISLLLLFPRPSLAEDAVIEACFSAYEETQVRLKAKEYGKARELARACSSGCPAEIVEQCQTWAWEAERDAPSVLLVARLENGLDAPGVSVTVDGEWKPLQKEVLLDPGPHEISFSRSDGWKSSFSVQIHAGEKRRAIRAEVPEEGRKGGEEVTPPPPPPAPEARRSHLPWAIASFAVGAIGFGLSGTYTAIALDRRKVLDECAPSCEPRQVQAAHDALTVADIGLVVGGVGVATGLGILIWGGPKSKAPPALLTLSPSTSGVGTVLRGRF
jgi:hypothetical protein